MVCIADCRFVARRRPLCVQGPVRKLVVHLPRSDLPVLPPRGSKVNPRCVCAASLAVGMGAEICQRAHLEPLQAQLHHHQTRALARARVGRIIPQGDQKRSCPVAFMNCPASENFDSCHRSRGLRSIF